MFVEAAAAGVGLLVGVIARRELAAGRWRRDTDTKPLPGFAWVVVAMPLVLAIVARHTASLSWWTTPAYGVLAVVGVVLGAVDADVHRLPDRLTLPAIPLVGSLLALASAGLSDWSRMGAACVGLTLAGLGFLALALSAPSGLGLGDVKLALLLGGALGWLGWSSVLAWLFYGFLFGGLWALALLIARRATRKTHVAFGPPLLLGALLALLTVPSL